MHGPQHTFDGMLLLCCIFCNSRLNTIEHDRTVHLQDIHRKGLVTRLDLRGKGFDEIQNLKTKKKNIL
jgi:hypothetical protein